MTHTTAQQVREAAEHLLASEPANGRAGDPLPIRESDGVLAGWFVPVIADGLLCSFLQFDAALHVLRHSRLHRPAAPASWIDPDLARRTAAARFPDAVAEGEPFLTYDRDVTRLVWAVPAKDGGRIFVAGDYAYPEIPHHAVTG